MDINYGQWLETPKYGNSTYTTPFPISFNNQCTWIKSHLRYNGYIFEFGITSSKTSFTIRLYELNEALFFRVYAIGY